MSARHATILSLDEPVDRRPLVFVAGPTARHITVHLEGHAHVFNTADLAAALNDVLGGGDSR